MEKLNIALGKIDIIVLSHIHGDHTGGIEGILERNSNLTVHLPISFHKNFKNGITRYGVKVHDVKSFKEILKSVWTTGELGTLLKEQSLILNTEKGLIIITGCAHPGIINVIKECKKNIDKNIYLVLGGIHLFGMNKQEINFIIEEFRKLGVEKVGPCHCSGELARGIFKENYGNNYIPVGVGFILEEKWKRTIEKTAITKLQANSVRRKVSI